MFGRRLTRDRILTAFALPPDNQRVAIVTPLISGGSLAGILEWRAGLAPPSEPHHVLKFRRRAQEQQDGSENHGTLDEEEIKAVVKQALEGMVYLHSRGFLHRDIKAGNLLIAPDGTVLLADFGVAGDINESHDSGERHPARLAADELRFGTEMTNRELASRPPHQNKPYPGYGKRRSFVGTPSWMAPEVVLGQTYDAKADVWSLGITVLELACGFAPGHNAAISTVFKHTVAEAPPALDRISGRFSKHMSDFVDRCLCKEPKQR